MLTGSSGDLGRAIQMIFPRLFPDDELIPIYRSDDILASTDDVRHALSILQPDMILHCAGVSSPALCEENKEVAMHLHRDVARALAEYAERSSGWLLYCSTDFVFPGDQKGLLSEGDMTCALNFYGRSKLAGEAVMRDYQNGLVARLSLMFAPPPRVVPSRWALLQHRLKMHQPVLGIVDEWRTPISFSTAAELLLRLAGQRRTGLVHIGGPEPLTPYELILRMARQLQSSSEIVPVRRGAFEKAYKRPENVALGTAQLSQWVGLSIPDPIADAAWLA